MARNDAPEGGTLVIAALLLLVLGFAGVWIVSYVEPDTNPWAIIPYFLAAAGAIVVVGLTMIVLRGRRA
jgi:hypothetical protein